MREHRSHLSRTARLILGTVVLCSFAACGSSSNQAPGSDAGAHGGSDGGADAGACQGPQCAFKVGNPVVVAQTSGGGAAVSAFSIALGSDGKTVAAGWTEISGDDQVVKVAASKNGGQSFTTPIPVDTPADVQLASVHLVVPDGAGILAGVVARRPYDEERQDGNLAHVDPDAPWDSWGRIYQSTDGAASFKQLADLKTATGVRTFTDEGFAASADGKTLVYAWVDVTPGERLAVGAPPPNSVLASISTDSGKTFGAPQTVSTKAFLAATRLPAFVRNGAAGVVYAQEHALTGLPTAVGFPFIAQASAAGSFATGAQIGADDYGALPAGVDGTVGGAAPGAAVGKDGSVHVAWWSAKALGLWVSASADGSSFATPKRVFATAQPTPANVKLAVDGAGNTWIAAQDGPGVRVVLVPSAGEPAEVMDAALATLGNAARGYTVWAAANDTFDIAGLPGSGAVVMWLGGQPPDASSTSAPPPQPINVRTIAP
jgi:hypothetical protein